MLPPGALKLSRKHRPCRRLAAALALLLASDAARLFAQAPAGAQAPASAQPTTAPTATPLPPSDDPKRLIELGQFPAAEAALRHSLEVDPSQADAHYLLGYVLFRERKPTESLAEFTAGARGREPTSEELKIVASDYISLKDYADAERWLRFATEHAPADAAAWYLLGRTQYNEDHAADAISSFQRCLRLRPRDLKAEYNLGLAYERVGQPNQAIAAYTSAIEWDRQQPVRDAQPYLDLGMLHLGQGQAEKALGPLREAVKLGDRNPLAAQELGLALEAVGRFDEALVSLRRAAELAPAAERPHFFLGRLYRRLGRKQDAAAEFALVAQLVGSHSEAATPNEQEHP